VGGAHAGEALVDLDGLGVLVLHGEAVRLPQLGQGRVAGVGVVGPDIAKQRLGGDAVVVLEGLEGLFVGHTGVLRVGTGFLGACTGNQQDQRKSESQTHVGRLSTGRWAFTPAGSHPGPDW
jgi:hypothetical protein